MSKIFKYIVSRLKEPSTRVALLGIFAGITGIVLSPEQTEAILGFGGALILLIISFTPDKPAE